MRNKLTLVITVVLLSVGACLGILFLKERNDSVCDTTVEMKDGTIYECSSTMSFDSGITSIRGCDGSKVSVPTIDIKTIK